MSDPKKNILNMIKDIIVEVLLRLGRRFLSPLENALMVYDRLYEAFLERSNEELEKYLKSLTPDQLEQVKDSVFKELTAALEAEKKIERNNQDMIVT